MARPSGGARRRDRAGAPRGDRGDPGRRSPARSRYARPLEGAFGAAIRTGVERGAAPVRRPDPRPRRGPGARARRLRRPGQGRAEGGQDPGRPAVRLPRGRAGRLAAGLGRRRAARRRPRAPRPARRGDLRLHRRALGRLGRGLRAGAARAGGRAPAPPPRAAGAAAPGPARGGGGDKGGGAGRRLEARPQRGAARRAGGGPGPGRTPPSRRRTGRFGGWGRLRTRVGRGEPARAAELRSAAESVTAALGPTVPRRELRSAWSLAKAALRAAEAGVLGGPGPILAEDHLAGCWSSSRAAWRTGSPSAGSRRLPSSPRLDAPGWRRRPWPSSSTAATPPRWRGHCTCTRRRSAIASHVCASCSAISSRTRTHASSWSWRSGQLGRGGQLGQLQPDHGTPVGRVPSAGAPALFLGYALHDCEAQPGARLATRLIGTPEAVEDLVELTPPESPDRGRER